MPASDTIVRPSLLLKSTVRRLQQTDTAIVKKTVNQSDTISLLRLKESKSFKLSDVRFEEEGYFKGSKYFKLDKGGSRNGVLGDPVPYTFSTDNTITGVLLVCFIMAMFSFSVSRNFILSQIQTFFGAPRSVKAVAENISEGKVMPLLILLTSLFLSVIYFILCDTLYGVEVTEGEQLVRMGFYFGEFALWFGLKKMMYNAVNWVFFEREKKRNWDKVWLFLSTMEGVLLFPLVLLLVYFSLSFQAAIIYVLVVIGLIKLLQLYKAYSIFFRLRPVSVQIFLYFCTLEVVPLLLLWGVLEQTSNYLEINI